MSEVPCIAPAAAVRWCGKLLSLQAGSLLFLCCCMRREYVWAERKNLFDYMGRLARPKG
jgi:hypothetical protein